MLLLANDKTPIQANKDAHFLFQNGETFIEMFTKESTSNNFQQDHSVASLEYANAEQNNN